MTYEELEKQYNDAKRYIELFEERAGIIQYDVGYSKEEAERLARIEMRKIRYPELYK